MMPGLFIFQIRYERNNLMRLQSERSSHTKSLRQIQTSLMFCVWMEQLSQSSDKSINSHVKCLHGSKTDLQNLRMMITLRA